MIEEFHYRVGWRTSSAHHGHHGSRTRGAGYLFDGHTSLINQPDPRKLDVHATLHNPFGELQVKLFRQTSSLPIVVVADFSASLNFGSKPTELARCVSSIAYSAYRTGDPFAFFVVRDRIEWQLHWPLRIYKGLAWELGARLERLKPKGDSTLGLIQLGAHLGARKSLVFLLSDFHFPLEQIMGLLQSYQPHDVVPVVFWDQNEWQLPNRGLLRLRDPESGFEKAYWMTPKLKRQITRRFKTRRKALTALCRRFGRPPLFLENRFSADQFSQYFLSMHP